MAAPERQVNDPLARKPIVRPNSIYRNTERSEPEQPEQPTPPTAPIQRAPEPEPIAPTPPVVQQAQPVQRQIAYSTELPGQPQTHDRRHKVPFEQRYRKENIQVDRRILPYFYDLIASGNSRVAVINQVLLKALLEAGYPVDPHILEKPFRYEDVPRD